MPIIDQPSRSTLSLQGGNIPVPPQQQSAWGFPDSTGPNALIPDNSKLHLNYSVDGAPNVRIVDFNRRALGGSTTAGLMTPSKIDELDPNAPKLTVRGVVSQTYNSPTARQYKTLGPPDGRY